MVLPFECDGLVISKKATEKLGEGIQNTPVGTGPYVATLVPNKSLTYRRFAGWNAHWDRPVYWKGINYVLAGTVPSGQSTLVPLEAGAVQIDPVPTQTDVEQLKGNTNFRTYEAPSLSVTWIGLNVQYPALSDIRVRQAIRYALDVPESFGSWACRHRLGRTPSFGHGVQQYLPVAGGASLRPRYREGEKSVKRCRRE